MATITQRGQAAIHGVAGSFDVILYPVQQQMKLAQDWEEEIGKDVDGFDAWWLARNEHAKLNFKAKLVADTAAHAATPVTDADKSTLGQPFLKPYQTVTLSGFTLGAFNGAYQFIGGAAVDLENIKVGDIDINLRRYADSTQNTSATTAPS